MAFIVFHVVRFRRWTVLKNISIAFPQLTKLQKYKIAEESIVNMGLGLFEFFSLSQINSNWVQKNITIHGWENFEQAQNKNKGVLMISIHLGNGDFACSVLSLLGLKINLISKKFKINWINNLWFGVRESMGTKFIEPHGRQSAFAILAACKQKENVIFVLDQFMGRPYGIETTFFGRKTGTAYGLALFAIKTEAPVLPVYTYRDSNNKTQIVFDPEIVFTGSFTNRDLQIKEMTQQYNHWIEQTIAKHPEQWMWIHRRWKRWE